MKSTSNKTIKGQLLCFLVKPVLIVLMFLFDLMEFYWLSFGAILVHFWPWEKFWPVVRATEYEWFRLSQRGNAPNPE